MAGTCANRNSAIYKLGDSCWHRIFSFVPFEDRLKLEKVCVYWRKVLKKMWLTVEVLDTVNRLPFWISKENRNVKFLKEIFERTQLKKLIFEGKKFPKAEGLILSIVRRCPELEELRLHGVKLGECEFMLLSYLKNLKILCLHACEHLKDSGLKILLKDNISLTHLELTGSYHMTGQFLKSVKAPLEILNITNHKKLDLTVINENLGRFSSTLKHLNLSDNEDFDVEDIAKCLPDLQSLTLAHYKNRDQDETDELSFITKLKKLESLNLANNEFTSDTVLECLALGCPQLKSLDLMESRLDIWCEGRDDFVSVGKSLSAFPNLQYLNLSNLWELDGDEIKKYAAQSPPVETLYLINLKYLKDDDAKSLLTNCHRLKFLDINGCRNVSQEVVNTANEVLEKRTDNRPLHIVAPNTKIASWVYNDGNRRTLSTHPLLTVTFETNLEQLEVAYFSGPYCFSDYLYDDDEAESEDDDALTYRLWCEVLDEQRQGCVRGSGSDSESSNDSSSFESESDV